MKKLLGLLGALGLTVSAGATVVACQAESEQINFDNKSQQDSISKIMSSYSKGLFLNQNELGKNKYHFSSEYLMAKKIKNSYLSDLGLKDFNENEGVMDTTRYSEIYNKYLDSNLLSDDLKLSDDIYQGEVLSPESSIISTLSSITGMVPTILNLLSDPSKVGQLLLGFASNVDKISSIISPSVLKTLANVLNDETLETLENAFSNDIYKDMSYQEALNSSVIGLSNVVNKLINGKNVKKLAYKSNEDIKTNFKEATNVIATNVLGLFSGEKSFKFDILENIDSIAEVIRFVRTMVLYLDSFKDELVKETPLTINDVDKKRTQKIGINKNSFDVKKILEILEKMVKDDSGVVFKNLVNIFLSTNEKIEFNKPYKSTASDGYMSIITAVVEKLAGGESLKVGTFEIYVSSFVRKLFDYGLGQKVDKDPFPGIFAALPTFIDKLPEMLKKILKPINDNNNDWEKFSKDWLGYLWNNNNPKLNLSIKGLLNNPIKNILSGGLLGIGGNTEKPKKFNQQMSTFSLIFGEKSLADIIKDLNSSLQPTNSDSFTINFDIFKDLIVKMRKDDTLVRALRDVENMFFILGLEKTSDGKANIKADSVLEQLFKIVKEVKPVVEPLMKVIDGYLKSYNKSMDEVTSEAFELFKKLTVTTEIKDINDFIYTVSDGKITNKFEIKLKVVNKKLKVSEINLIK